MNRIVRTVVVGFGVLLLSGSAGAVERTGDPVLRGEPVRLEPAGLNTVRHRCLAPDVRRLTNDGAGPLGLTREHPWSLPTAGLSANGVDTIHCLVARFNFQFETVDIPTTTGRGVMDVSRPLDTLTDSAYIVREGNLIDPPPHDSLYFDRHMRALNRFWNTASDGRLVITWDIWPPGDTATYQLPDLMTEYGKADFSEVIPGLEKYFTDCVAILDTAHLAIPGHPDIDFTNYQSMFFFHAGADRQNDFGFPPTPNDLFTGFIRFAVPIPVDGGDTTVQTALMMPETASQDNRATALNAVLAHEFGHQLGLPDIYSTSNFLSQVGDFCLMDNNGFGTGIDFGFPDGAVFGALPIFPSAWCRAYLGFVDVVDFRQGTDIRIVAANIESSGIKVARIPISEHQYYLIENRQVELDGPEQNTAIRADSATSVILGPADFETGEFTREYDNLLPGSGLAIYYIDESIAQLDYDGDGLDNYRDNQLQLFLNDSTRRFLSLVEADGLVNFGGFYRSGFGRAEDLFREDRNNAFTPTTNPQTRNNRGGETRIAITDIRRAVNPTTGTILDTVMTFDLTIDGKVEGSPVRIGVPPLGLSPISYDLDNDGVDEFIVPSGPRLSIFDVNGRSLLNKVDSCATCPPYVDTAVSNVFGWSDYNPGTEYTVPIFFEVPDLILTANPVVGDYAGSSVPLVVAAYAILSTNGDTGQVVQLTPTDNNSNGFADQFGPAITTDGLPIAMLFDSVLHILTTNGHIYTRSTPTAAPTVTTLPNDIYHGLAQIGGRLVLHAGDSSTTTLYTVGGSTIDSISVDGLVPLGPVVTDLDRNDQPEIIIGSRDGRVVIVETDVAGGDLRIRGDRTYERTFVTNPTIGDVDRDDYPDIVFGGVNEIHAFDRNLVSLSDFPRRIDDQWPNDFVLGSVILADIESGGDQEFVTTKQVGTVHALNTRPVVGFPLASGERETVTGSANGSVIYVADTVGGVLGFIGADGWFYLWRTDMTETEAYWPMYGSSPGGSFAFDATRLDPPSTGAGVAEIAEFYVYPNPVTNGSTTLRYRLMSSAESITWRLFDLSGQLIREGTSPMVGMTNEIELDLSAITPGVYRCLLDIDFGGATETAFTDIAIIN